MTRGTKLFQEPGSPLIQGRSRTQRPWWHGYVVGVALALLWPLLTYNVAGMNLGDQWPGVTAALLEALRSWVAAAPLIVTSALLGGAIGMVAARGWGLRHSWVAVALGGIIAWYVSSSFVTLIR